MSFVKKFSAISIFTSLAISLLAVSAVTVIDTSESYAQGVGPTLLRTTLYCRAVAKHNGGGFQACMDKFHL